MAISSQALEGLSHLELLNLSSNSLHVLRVLLLLLCLLYQGLRFVLGHLKSSLSTLSYYLGFIVSLQLLLLEISFGLLLHFDGLGLGSPHGQLLDILGIQDFRGPLFHGSDLLDNFVSFLCDLLV